jgi:hypothetical protein
MLQEAHIGEAGPTGSLRASSGPASSNPRRAAPARGTATSGAARAVRAARAAPRAIRPPARIRACVFLCLRIDRCWLGASAANPTRSALSKKALLWASRCFSNSVGHISGFAARDAGRDCLQHPLRRGRRDCLQASLQARLRRHRVKTAWIAISVGQVGSLAQDQESGGSRGEARG